MKIKLLLLVSFSGFVKLKYNEYLPEIQRQKINNNLERNLWLLVEPAMKDFKN